MRWLAVVLGLCSCGAEAALPAGESGTSSTSSEVSGIPTTTMGADATSSGTTSAATDTGAGPIHCDSALDPMQCAAAQPEDTFFGLPCLWVPLVRTSSIDDTCSFEVVGGKCLAPSGGDTGCGGYDADCGYEATYRVEDDGSILMVRIEDACSYYWGDWSDGFERAQCQEVCNPCDTTGTDSGGVVDPEWVACHCACAADYPD